MPGTSAGPEGSIDCESEIEFISSGWRYSDCSSCAAHDNCFDCQEDSCTWCGDGAGYCVSATDDDACADPRDRTDGCGGIDPDPDPDPAVSCTNTCSYAGDGDCDDGGPGSDFSLCPLGTDCTDCGPR